MSRGLGDVYKRQVIDRLIAREKTSLRFFFGKLKGSELLESMEQEVLSFRRRTTLREM